MSRALPATWKERPRKELSITGSRAALLMAPALPRPALPQISSALACPKLLPVSRDFCWREQTPGKEGALGRQRSTLQSKPSSRSSVRWVLVSVVSSESQAL